MTNLLLLAGTAEARALAAQLSNCTGLSLISSLSGATRAPAAYPGTLRSGGFGGASGLRDYLKANRIGAVVDATHPFAATISQTSVSVTADLGCPLLRLQRPAWVPGVQETWQCFDTVAEAIAALPETATALLATGAKTAALPLPPGPSLILRAIDQPAEHTPENLRLVLARPPYSPDWETALMRDQGVTHLVCKNSGGREGRSKLDAANGLGVVVHMVNRPPAPTPSPRQVATVQEAVDWVRRVANGDPSAARGA